MCHIPRFSQSFRYDQSQNFLRKLNKYGIRGKALELITSYLKDRQQYVSLGDSQSTQQYVSIGVPQGSILGPLLFLIYINDLPTATKFFIKLYADDTFLCYQHEDSKLLEREVNTEIDKVYKWLASNQLTLNVRKSKCMIITKKRINTTQMKIKIDGTELEKCDSYKYLGVFFDTSLMLNLH